MYNKGIRCDGKRRTYSTHIQQTKKKREEERVCESERPELLQPLKMKCAKRCSYERTVYHGVGDGDNDSEGVGAEPVECNFPVR